MYKEWLKERLLAKISIAVMCVVALLVALTLTISPVKAIAHAITARPLESSSVCGQLGASTSPIHFNNVTGPEPSTTTYQNGHSPLQINEAYGIATSFKGAGVTIAIVDPCDDPNAAQDFDTFSAQFGLPTIVQGKCGCFTKVNQTGGGTLPPPDAYADIEISMDIEWAHAIAPSAHILLVEANSSSFSDLLVAEDYATAHAKVVSNSWDGSESSGETTYDTHFNKPVAITVAAGDHGTPAQYPSSSPYVLSVGGTSLAINGTMSGGGCIKSGCTYGGESVWNNAKGIGGGAPSADETVPAYQSGYCGSTANMNACNGKRGTPDLSWIADPGAQGDPNTGVAIFDSIPYKSLQDWYVEGGTSLGAPSIAAVIAIADQETKTTLTTNNLSQRFSYQNAGKVGNYSLDYHDITTGANGSPCCMAGKNYDLASGLGSPRGNSWACATVVAWCIMPSPNTSFINELDGMAVASSTDIWAVGYTLPNGSSVDQTLIEHWNGTSWSAVPSLNVGPGDNELTKVVVVSSTDVWAVGWYDNGTNKIGQTLTEHWDGTKWSVVSSPNVGTGSNILWSVAAAASNNVWAVGEVDSSDFTTTQTLIEHWNGSSWSVVSSPTITGTSQYYLKGVTAVPGTNELWAVGYSRSSSALIEHWTGSIWQVVTSPSAEDAGNLLGVMALSATNVWAVGTYFNNTLNVRQTLIEQWNGTSWSIVPSPNVNASTGANSDLLAVTAVSSNNVWAVGGTPINYPGNSENTLIEHWNGTSWTIMPSSNTSAPYNYLNDVKYAGMGRYWSVGASSGSTIRTLIEVYD